MNFSIAARLTLMLAIALSGSSQVNAQAEQVQMQATKALPPVMCQSDFTSLNQHITWLGLRYEIRACQPVSNQHFWLWIVEHRHKQQESQLLWVRQTKQGWQGEAIFERDVVAVTVLPDQPRIQSSNINESQPWLWWVITEHKRAKDLLVQHHLLSFTAQGWQHKLTTRISQRTQCDDQQAYQWTELQWAFKQYGAYAYLYEQQQRQRWHETEQGKTRVETSQSAYLIALFE